MQQCLQSIIFVWGLLTKTFVCMSYFPMTLSFHPLSFIYRIRPVRWRVRFVKLLVMHFSVFPLLRMFQVLNFAFVFYAETAYGIWICYYVATWCYGVYLNLLWNISTKFKGKVNYTQEEGIARRYLLQNVILWNFLKLYQKRRCMN